MSWRFRTALLLMGAWGWGLAPGWAKPPDLPARQTVICQPAALEQFGIDFNAMPKDLLVTEEEQESLEPLDLICPCFWEVLRSYWQSWCLSLRELGSGSAGAADQTMAPPPSSENPPRCPYLRENAARKAIGQALPPATPNSVLDNLNKLEQARALWLQAEMSRREGDAAAAFAGYTQIRKLCPGSSFERMAAQRLGDLQARGVARSPAAEAGEEQEAPPGQSRR